MYPGSPSTENTVCLPHAAETHSSNLGLLYFDEQLLSNKFDWAGDRSFKFKVNSRSTISVGKSA